MNENAEMEKFLLYQNVLSKNSCKVEITNANLQRKIAQTLRFCYFGLLESCKKRKNPIECPKILDQRCSFEDMCIHRDPDNQLRSICCPLSRVFSTAPVSRDVGTGESTFSS